MATQLPIFPLETIVEEPLSFEFEVPFAREELDREPLVAVRPARIAGEVTPVEGGYALTASLAWDGRLECSRCLADYDFSHQEEFTSSSTRGRPFPRRTWNSTAKISMPTSTTTPTSPSRRSSRSASRWRFR